VVSYIVWPVYICDPSQTFVDESLLPVCYPLSESHTWNSIHIFCFVALLVIFDFCFFSAVVLNIGAYEHCIYIRDI